MDMDDCDDHNMTRSGIECNEKPTVQATVQTFSVVGWAKRDI